MKGLSDCHKRSPLPLALEGEQVIGTLSRTVADIRSTWDYLENGARPEVRTICYDQYYS